MLQLTYDRYGGVIVDQDSFPDTIPEFKEQIEQLIENLNDKKLLWVKVPIEKSEFIPILTRLGFEFHYCDEKNLMLVKKLIGNSFVPTARNFVVGIGAIVIHEGKLLVVRDKFSPDFKLPGGHIEKNEPMKKALKREVFEETGIDTELESIINIGHFPVGQFGESVLYIVCTARALTTSISINDSLEIVEAKWVDPLEYVEADFANVYNKNVVKAALNNKDIKLTERTLPLKIAGSEVFL